MTTEQPTITTTLGEILRANSGPRHSVPGHNALASLIIQPLPLPRAFEVMQIIKQINREIESYNEVLTPKCNQYGQLSEDKTHYEFPILEKREAFEKEHAELMAKEVTLNGSPIKISDLGGISLSTQALIDLSWLIVG